MRTERFILFLGISILLSACSTTRTVPEGDRLFTGSKIKWEGKKGSGSLEDELLALARPKPNRKFLGMPVRLWLYNLGNEPKGKGLNYLLRKKWGEPPVLLSKAKPAYTGEVMTRHLEDNGYMQATVRNETKNSGKKKASITYTANLGERYRIREVVFETDSSELGREILRDQRRSLLRQGKYYQLDRIKEERQRISNNLRQKGYYYFQPDHLLAEVDSNFQGEVMLYLRLKDSIPDRARRAFTMETITLYPTYNLAEDSLVKKADSVDIGPYHVKDLNDLFLPKIFTRYVLLKEDSLYRYRLHERTLERLMSLGTFKFVKSEFEQVDSSKLHASFFMTPSPRRSLQAELNGNSKSNNFVGTQLTISSLNRNWLKRGNRFEVKLSGGFEWQVGGKRLDQANTRGYSFNAEVAVNLPGLIVPFVKIPSRRSFVPRTRISGSYEILSRPGLYNLNSVSLQQAYQWKNSRWTEHQLVPVSISYVLPTRISPVFEQILENDPALRQSIEKQFIIGSNYTATYNTLPRVNSNGIFLQGNLDVAGNLLGLLIPKNKDGVRTIGYQPFAQYAKVTGEARHYWRFTRKHTWVNRLLAGYGYSYGNNVSLPFVKQYFIGGSNSLRAFRARTLGPGSYQSANSTFAASEAGDIRLEANTELRFDLISVVKGAIFADAGNIWLQRENPEKPGAAWPGSRFWNDMAVGGGLGIRVDASIVVVRLDLAIPLRKPWLPAGQQWVFDQINFGSSDWRRENMVLNIAIGYPF